MNAFRTPFRSAFRGIFRGAFEAAVVFLVNQLQNLTQWFTGVPSGTEVQDQERKGTPRTIQPGRYYDFDGTDDTVQFSDEDAFTFGDGSTDQPFSFVGWFRFDNAGGAIMAKASGVSAGEYYILNSGGDLFFRCVDNSTGGYIGQRFDYDKTNEWNFLAFTYDGSGDETGLKLYEDFLEITPTSTSNSGLYTAMENTSQPFVLGVRDTSYFDGKMFDVRMYSKELSLDEITYIGTFGESGTNPGTTDLITQVKMDEGDNTLAYDSSGNNRHGTITNATLSTFHAEGNTVPYSYQNEVGYTEGYNLFPNSTWTGVSTTGTTGSINISTSSGGITASASTIEVDGETYLDYTLSGTNTSGGTRFFNVFSNGPNCDVTDGMEYVITGDLQIISGSLGSNAMRTSFSVRNSSNTTVSGNFTQINSDISTTMQRVSISGTLNGTGNSYVDRRGYYFRIAAGNSINVTIRFGRIQIEKETTTASTYQKTFGDMSQDVLLPRNESDITKDVSETDLQYTGEVPHSIALVNSNCGTFDGTDDYVDFGSQTITIEKFSIRFAPGAVISTSTAAVNLCGVRDTINDGFFLGSFTSAVTNESVSVSLGNSRTSVTGITFNAGQIYKVSFEWNDTENRYDIYLDDELQIVTSGAANHVTKITTTKLELGRSTTGVRYFNGRLFDLKIEDSTGVVLHAPLAEGNGTTIYDVSGNENHGTATNITESSFWGTTQDEFHWNITKGFTLSGSTYIPALADGSTDAAGNPITNPAVATHNNAETQFDFTGAESDAPWVTRVYRGYADFDGTDDYITLPFAVSATSSYELSLEFKTSAASQRMFDARDARSEGIQINMMATGYVVGSHNSASPTTTTNYNDGEWHTAKLAWDGSTVTLTVDDEVITQSIGDTIATTTNARIAARSYTSATAEFDGQIRNVSLTIDGAKKAEYTLASDALDSSGNNNHATVTNATFPTYTVPTTYSFGDSFSPSGQTNQYKKEISSTQEGQFALYDVGLGTEDDTAIQTDGFTN